MRVLRRLELTEALARHSLIDLDSTELGRRPRMLETIRAFVAEQFAARAGSTDIHRRHAGYYRALAERADRPLRRAGWREWAERLRAEEGNLAAAVRWYLAHDPGPLPAPVPRPAALCGRCRATSSAKPAPGLSS